MDVNEDDAAKRNSLAFPMELGAPAFAPIDVFREKDTILNMGRQHAQEEYNRIMEQVEVLKRQADALVNRMQLSEIMHHCVYGFKPVYNKVYYVYFDSRKNHYWLSPNHPRRWCAGPGEQHTYYMAVRMRGDSTWQEVGLDPETDDPVE